MPDKPTHISHEGPRIETGPVQFGVFIPADEAARYAAQLRARLENSSDHRHYLTEMALEELVGLLESCRALPAVKEGEDAE